MGKFINVLIADDDRDDHELFENALNNLKIGSRKARKFVKISSVYNGKEAVDYLLPHKNCNKDISNTPDFIVLDLNMPLYNGFDVLKFIQADKDLWKIPVYVLSTSKDKCHKAKCLELGCAGFFSKPTSEEELSKVIEKMMNAEPD